MAFVAVQCSTAVWIVYRYVFYSHGSAGSSGWAGDVITSGEAFVCTCLIIVRGCLLVRMCAGDEAGALQARVAGKLAQSMPPPGAAGKADVVAGGMVDKEKFGGQKRDRGEVRSYRFTGCVAVGLNSTWLLRPFQLKDRAGIEQKRRCSVFEY